MKQSEAQNMDDEHFREWWMNQLSGTPKDDIIQMLIDAQIIRGGA
tara:strand:+ start:604 stop:738 length:135 start_codon:yes stop_codon:yes gene_type:complete